MAKEAAATVPVNQEQYWHGRGEKRREELQPAQDAVCGIWPPVHVMREHGRDADPHGQSDRMQVRFEQVAVGDQRGSAREIKESLLTAAVREREALHLRLPDHEAHLFLVARGVRPDPRRRWFWHGGRVR